MPDNPTDPTRAEQARKYRQAMAQQEASQLLAARALMVQKYLAAILAGNPSPWPSGLDWDSHWYRNNKDYWNALAKKVDDRGHWINPQDDPLLNPESPPKPANSPAEVAAAIRKLVTKKQKPVTEIPVTENTPRVTKIAKSVTENTPVTEIPPPVTEIPKRRGRPKTKTSTSAKERMRLMRERRKK